ncbi:RIX1 [Candida oxycetoniae]|uniref:Pre-rRNA-processing protein RIX1 n=1 Tax=Candida oxycetoniae TaxID=497107 RepID=A0AAI9WWT1_9ASCO|nr:RIX1 [Candida oxycetoniae]KAI3403517.2 RIX1 [Candida oxycetoniae]
MSINLVLEEIKGSPTSSIIPTLSLLCNDKSLLSQISKSNLQHLTSRTLQLCRSSDIYSKWCGINCVYILCQNYTILASEGTNFLTQLITILESYNSTINVLILSSAVDAVNMLMRMIRGKPTLTREILTPKLSTIIGLYLKNIQYDATLCIKSLYEIIKFHPNTFRPFANKFSLKLYGLLREEGFAEYSHKLKVAIYRALAILPVIEKNDPDVKWGNDVKSIVGEITGILGVYQEFLNFKDDASLDMLLKKLPSTARGERGQNLFNDLEIDVNEPGGFLQLSNRVGILLALLKHYITDGGVPGVRIPIGMILVLIEVVFSINTRFLSFKSDVRDEEVRKLVSLTLVKNHLSTLDLLRSLLKFKGDLIPHLYHIWTILEFLVPVKNNNNSSSKKVSSSDVFKYESLYVEQLKCVGDYLNLVGTVSDSSVLLPFIDVALALTEVRKETLLGEQQAADKKKNGKTKKKKNTSAVALSDILSHEHLFQSVNSEITLSVVRSFLNQVIQRIELPPQQHYRTMKFIIKESIVQKNANLESIVPKSLRDLLVNAVLNPGYDKSNILPIVSSILEDDQLISVFNNPRFPALPKYYSIESTDEGKKNVKEEDEKEEEEEEEECGKTEKMEVAEGKKFGSAKETAIYKLLKEQQLEQHEQHEQHVEQSMHEEKQLKDDSEENIYAFTSSKRPFESDGGDGDNGGDGGVVFGKKTKIEIDSGNASVVERIEEKVFASGDTRAENSISIITSNQDDECSDFEMPAINVEEDTEEEDEED